MPRNQLSPKLIPSRTRMKFLIVLVLIQNLVIGKIQIPSESSDLFNNMMRYLFKNCRSEFGSIGFWGNDRIFLADDEADFVLFNKNEISNKLGMRRIKLFMEILDKSNINSPNFHLFKTNVTLEIETMFVFDKTGYNYTNIIEKFSWFQKLFKTSKIYYCFEYEEKIIVISLNAFADVAPELWTKDNDGLLQYDEFTDWRIIETQYDEKTKFNLGYGLCKNFFFDRTKKLNGYTIRAIASLLYYPDTPIDRIDQFITKSSNISEIMFYSIINPIELKFSKALADYLDVQIYIIYGMPYAVSLDVTPWLFKDKIDLDLTSKICQPSAETAKFVANYYMSYPTIFSYDIIVTHNRGLMSPLEKMFEFYGWLTIIATLIILFLCFIVIYFAKHKTTSRISFAVFECLRLLISNSMVTRMDTNKIRIFFSVIFLYFLIIQATFSGHLAAFLTKPVYRKNVETLEDLKDLRYTQIYAPFRAQNYIEDKELLNKTFFSDSICLGYINDPSIACINQEKIMLYLKAKHNLHTPKDPVIFNYGSQFMHHNWALKHKVNNLILRLAQSRISDFWTRNSQNSTITVRLKKMQEMAENYHRPIEIEDITFALILLVFGLLFAFACFILEYSIKIYLNIRLNKKNLRTYLLNVKKSTIGIVHFVICKIQSIFKWLYTYSIKMIGNE